MVRTCARGCGRDPDSLRFPPGLVPYICSTEVEARRLTEGLFELDVPETQIARAAELVGAPFTRTDLDLPADWAVIEAARRIGGSRRARGPGHDG